MDKDSAYANSWLREITTKYGRSVSQVMLRWAMQQGCAVIPGTSNPDHMKENLSIYEFYLRDDDMDVINQLKHGAKWFNNIDVRQLE